MKSLRTMSKLVLVGGIAMSSLSIIPLHTSAASVLATQTMNQESSYAAIFTEDDYNKNVSVKKGEIFAVQLENKYRSGNGFLAIDINDMIPFIKEDMDVPSGSQRFVFQADSVGTTTLQIRQVTDSTEDIIF
ncbi:hypothetical protein PVK73_30805, partial [Bacillus thuringiensis]